MPRSIRVTAGKPQCLAISVAFDDHGEIVPSRGVTSSSVPLCVTGGGCRSVGQDAFELVLTRSVQRLLQMNEMPEFGIDLQTWKVCNCGLQQFFPTECREGVASSELEELRHDEQVMVKRDFTRKRAQAAERHALKLPS